MANKFIRNLQIGFAISFLLLISSSVASYISIKNLLDNQRWVEHSLEVLKTLDDVHLSLKDKVIGIRGFLLTKDDKFIEPYYNNKLKKDSLLASLSSQISDNPVQVKNVKLLTSQLSDYDAVLDGLVSQGSVKSSNDFTQIELGSQLIERCQAQIVTMKDEERVLLEERTIASSNSSSLTPIFLIISGIISLVITLVFYLRIKNDFTEREQLKASLVDKDLATGESIVQIEEIAHQISLGNYETRIESDKLGLLSKLSHSLNNMAISLETSFNKLNDNEWLQQGLADLNENLVGDKTVDIICEETINHMIQYGQCINGAIYLHEDGILKLKKTYAKESFMKPFFNEGEGLVGQVFNDKKLKVITLPEEMLITAGIGAIKLSHLLLCPILVHSIIVGVVEVGSSEKFTEVDLLFHSRIAETLGVAITSAKSRWHIQDLLEETQTQTEELQSQHSELENLNSELEAQAQKLQASEEELRVQQEELIQSNKELESRSALLEEKNFEIIERNAQIQQKAKELELSTKYKSEFLANMSHELRTPLNSILLLSRLTAENPEGNLNEEQIESAKVIQSSGNGLLALIDEILDLSKIESGKMDINIETTSIDSITTEIKNLFGLPAKNKNIEFNINVNTSHKQIDTDSIRLGQVIKNLISNAIKFTERGGVTLDIDDADDKIIFKISDTGIGIKEDNQRIIFEAFQQADGTTRRRFGGTGLGLSISRELVKLLGGTIEVESNPGKGSVFTATFPLKIVDKLTKKEPEVNITELVVASENIFNVNNYVVDTIPEEIEDDRTSIKDGDNVILIVEDDTVVAKALLNFARKSNYKGIVIVRGDLALPAALQFNPKAILLDIQLPIMDGWMVMDQLKSHSQTKHVPVHIMSSMQAKKESLLKGAVDFIDKPFAIWQMFEVFKKIEEALNKGPRKVLIIEENNKHANALSYFLGNFDISAEIKSSVADSAAALQENDVDCVILDMGVPYETAYETLETIRKNPGLENLPIIIFTGKNISKVEELKIKKYADSIIIKTAHSYQRVLDEVGLFLHLIDENNLPKKQNATIKLGTLTEVIKDKTVLIADDDVRNIFSLSKALEKHGMKVISAIDGKEAIQKLEENPQTDLILMDIMMPEMDGYETISAIRAKSKYRNLPIFAVTAKAMMGDREKCIQVGASDYISKPVDIDQLLSLLRVWLYKA